MPTTLTLKGIPDDVYQRLKASAAGLAAEHQVPRKGHRCTQARGAPVIVANTNVLAYLQLPYECSPQADALFQRDPELAVPILWRSESRNLLAGCLRRKTQSLDEVLKLQAEAEALVAGTEHEVESWRVLELAPDTDHSTYGCEFVALGARHGIQVATMDAKPLKAFPKHAVALSAP
jgi:hypothetical protein